MNFLEKDLETIIWENYEACFERGLVITNLDFDAIARRTRLRQPNLSPYGIADLINIFYDPSDKVILIQIIECKKDAINLETYMQAKRYQTACQHLIGKSIAKIYGHDCIIKHQTVLVGASFDSKNNFGYIYNTDPTCIAYTYSYLFDGIWFDAVAKGWRLDIADSSASQVFQKTVYDFLAKSTKEHEECLQDHAEFKTRWNQQHGDNILPLLVTSEGVLLNTELLGNNGESR